MGNIIKKNHKFEKKKKKLFIYKKHCPILVLINLNLTLCMGVKKLLNTLNPFWKMICTSQEYSTQLLTDHCTIVHQ